MNIQGINAIVQESSTWITWSLTLLAGSLAVLLGTSYVRPMNKWVKLIYLLFIPGWYFLAQVINYGNIIARRSIMAEINPIRISSIEPKMNDEFILQLYYFKVALFFLGLWLLLYLIWWVFSDFFISKK